MSGRKGRPLAPGNEDFARIVGSGGFYVDKTRFISDILDNELAEIKLFTRPRRFGKTLTLDMLRCFFDVRGAAENRALFDGLYIGNSPYMETHFGKYPVISLTLKGLDTSSVENLIASLRSRIASTYAAHDYLENSTVLTESDLKDYYGYRRQEKPDLTEALLCLCRLLQQHWGQRVVLLIDEYDAPILGAYDKGYYEEAVEFFKPFLSNALKTNPYLGQAVLTGISRVSKETIFSGLNNVQVYTTLSDDYVDCIGFTQVEVDAALAEYGMFERRGEVQAFYDGYRFGASPEKQQDLYNPYSIVLFLDSGRLDTYWVNTAGDSLLRGILGADLPRFMETFPILLEGGNVEVVLEENLSLRDIHCLDDAWPLLVYSGYLTTVASVDDEVWQVRIPNEEVRWFFRKMVRTLAKTRTNPVNLVDCLFDDFSKFKDLFNRFLQGLSYYDLKDENAYHVSLVIALLAYSDNVRYEVVSNRESGLGRPDILVRDNVNKRAVVIELKQVDKALTGDKATTAISQALTEAVAQAQQRHYGQDLPTGYQLTHLAAVGHQKEIHFQISAS